MDQTTYDLLLTAPGGGSVRDLTGLVQSVTWSGSVRQISRQLAVNLAVPRDGSVEPPALEEGAALTLRVRGGEALFTGPLLRPTTDSQSAVVSLHALDRGRFLVGNNGWYRFDGDTPERAVAAVCADFGIPTASLVPAGVRVSRKFPGVALDKIFTTLYALAGEQNGKRYLLRFTGDGQLEAVEKASAASMEIASTLAVTNSWDITDLCNSVAIYTDDGALVRRVQDSPSMTLNGRLEYVITQRDGEDAGAEAKAWLEDHGLQQTVTVETLGDPRLITGAAVRLRDTGSGVSGLFWIDADTHSWKNGVYTTKVTLNFRNLMNDSVSGREV